MQQHEITAPIDLQGKLGQIHLAARTLFLRQGYGNTNMDAVARLANVSKSTLYSHFENKAQLFGAVIAQLRQRLSSALLSISTSEGDDVAQSLRQLGQQFLRYVLDPETITLFRVVIGETDKFPELGREVWQSGHQEIQRIVAEFLQKSAERGALSVTDTTLAAKQFLLLCKSDLQMRWMMDADKIADEAEIAQAIEASVTMFLAAYGRNNKSD